MTEVISFRVRGILLDIEGTTSSIHFVYEVMFPFVRRELETYVARHWRDPQVATVLEQMAVDAGAPSLDAWLGSADEGIVSDESRDVTEILRGSETPRDADSPDPARAPPNSVALTTEQRKVVDETLRLMDQDVKSTGLKQLQGAIWEGGFLSGELRAHVFEDVPEALRRWAEQGFDVRIYSSGSIAAQRLFFGHTIVGDLLPLLRGHYDTTTGPKREGESYRRITQAMQMPPGDILFLSDIVAELDAAREAGLQTALCRRPGNNDPGEHKHPELRSFAELACQRSHF